MVKEVFDLEKLSKDEDFRTQLETAAAKLLKSGKTSGWLVESISYSTDEYNGGKDSTFISAKSKGKYDGRIAKFYATCADGICRVSSVSFIDPDAEKKGMMY